MPYRTFNDQKYKVALYTLAYVILYIQLIIVGALFCLRMNTYIANEDVFAYDLSRLFCERLCITVKHKIYIDVYPSLC